MTSQRHVRIATEGALLGSLIAHGVSPEMGVLSDGAGQFDVFVHALCWLHVERPLERLVPHNEKHRQAIERIRQRIWDLYTGLKAYQQAPSMTARDALAKQFDELVADRTDYPSIDGVLKGMAADRAQLLLVLQRPEVPLHNNLSEGHIRDYVKKRKISGSTRSDSGRRARDTFASLKKTCRRLGVNFWEYLQDRVRGLGKVPRLADLIRQKAEEAAARRAPAAPPPDPDGGAGGLNAGSGLRCLVSALRFARNDSEDPMPGVFEKLRLFVLSHNMPMTNTTGKLALFWRFSITASSLPSRLTDHYSLATRFTSHVPRPTIVGGRRRCRAPSWVQHSPPGHGSMTGVSG